MKKIMIICVIVSYNFVVGQNENPYQFMQNANGMPATNEKSIGNSTVNLCNGRLNSSIPLNLFVGRELNIPMSINYVTNGVKVTDIASTVGLGWEISIGGGISRAAVGIPDDAKEPTNTPCRLTQSDWEDNDYFIMNAINKYNCFRYEISSSIPSSKYDLTSLARYNTDANVWTVTLEDGTTLFFGENNAIQVSNVLNGPMYSYCPSKNIISKSLWLLTKIISKNNLDEYRFTYQNFDYLNYIPNNGEGTLVGLYDDVKITNSSYKENKLMIKEIYHNNEKIISFNYESRQDLLFVGGATVGNKLSEILFYNYKNLIPFKKIQFQYSYFGNVSSSNYLDKRLKLDQIVFKGCDANNLIGVESDNYKFEYFNPAQVPSITSYARDYLGLYNGVANNLHLIPTLTNNRTYNFQKSITGLLNRIEYPKKGFEIIEYEQHALNGTYGHIFIPQNNQVTPMIPAHYEEVDTKEDFKDGFRTKSITSYSANGVVSNKTEYKYSKGILQDFIPTGNAGNGPKRTSIGYLNAPNNVTYDSGKIVNIDHQGLNNGYIEHQFFTNDLTMPGFLRSPAIANHGLYISPSKREDLIGNLCYDPEFAENIIGINVFDKNSNLLSTETNGYCWYYIGPHPNINNNERWFTKYCYNLKEVYSGTNKVSKSESYENNSDSTIYGKVVDYGDGKIENYNYSYITNPLDYRVSRILSQTDITNENGNKIASKKNIYSIIGNRYLLTEIQSSTGLNVNETKLKYEYDSDGNLVEKVNVTTGIISNRQYECYIYGYNNRFVVAKITGARYSDIPLTNITAIKNASNQIINQSNNTLMETALNSLRNITALSNAQITTTTVNPIYGTTSVTDPKGYSIYYEYDILGRLSLTKEKNPMGGYNILTETKFNTRPN